VTRLWVVGERISVETDQAGAPVQFRWSGERHRVEAIADRWRADVQWWRLRVWREHFKLITDTGLLVIIYHDLPQDTWYLQRVYD
jgi:hypothetical protein